jgi:hypothetical protein
MINAARTPLYNRWVNMRQRCLNPLDPKYYRYGKRGIKICEEWNDFKTFEAWSLNNGYKPGLTLDRENNNGNYTPENCRWTSFKTQSNNTRKNVKLKVGDETKTVAQWVEDARCTVNAFTVYQRVSNGWTARDAILLPRYSRKTA